MMQEAMTHMKFDKLGKISGETQIDLENLFNKLIEVY